MNPRANDDALWARKALGRSTTFAQMKLLLVSLLVAISPVALALSINDEVERLTQDAMVCARERARAEADARHALLQLQALPRKAPEVEELKIELEVSKRLIRDFAQWEKEAQERLRELQGLPKKRSFKGNRGRYMATAKTNY